MRLTVELETKEEAPELPETLAYGATREDALASAQTLALRVLSDKLEHGEAPVKLP